MSPPLSLRSARPATVEAVTMVEQSPEELERMLDDGEWLKAGQVAALLGVDPATIHRRRAARKIRVRKQGGDGQYLFHPEDVRRLLDASREVHGGD